ncbi:hypothetical protein [Gracilimonas mengyeensis]|uniref:hypothetical protein n=1 Tax=Gracilimonas mengyeensis TaxID=1302730 RepID=UPI0011588A6F|nr:hypothetical protein [Gracilimonas mengyeensis]
MTSCLNTDTPDSYRVVEGVVLHNGAPVTDAGVHIRNHFDPGGFVDGENNAVKIQFETSIPEYFIGELYRYQTSEPFATFFSDSLTVGEYTLTVPDSLLSNGIFAYTIRTERSQGVSSLVVINKPDSLLPGTRPFTNTTAEGEFALSPIPIGFGDSFQSEQRGSFEITDSLEFIITAGDSIFATQKVEVKPNTDNFFEIAGN